MAVYYKWIKGCAENATINGGLWTYVKWAQESKASNQVANLPHIYTDTKRTASPSCDLGYVLTNNVEGVEIENPWSFKQNLCFDNTGEFITHKNGYIKYNQNTYTFNKNINVEGEIVVGTDAEIKGSTSVEGNIVIKGNLTAYNEKIKLGEHNITYNNQVLNNYKAIYTELPILTTDYIESSSFIFANQVKVEGECEAQFFTATSDIRAKKDIQIAQYNALDIVKNLLVYTYKYNNSDETVTGIMAQDLLKVQPDNLNLVSNVNATGQNNDYMSIKTDKMVYILLKAIQEQQTQIDLLIKEINILKSN